MRIGHYIESLLQIVGGVWTVPTADAVATSEVNCYNFVVRLRSLPRFAEND